MGDFLSTLVDALSSIGSEIEALVVYLFNILVTVLNFVWDVIQGIAGFLLTTTNDANAFSNFTWGGFFQDLWSRILDGIVKFGRWLAAIILPVVKFLRQVSQYIDRIYNHYVRPILRYLRIVRVFLTLLKALGVKWAGKLDSILGKIQSDIQRAFLTVKQYLNVVIDLLNILADPSNLLRRPTTLLSLRRIWNAFIRQVTGLPPGFVLPSPSKFAAPGIGPVGSNFDPRDPLQNPPPSYYLAFDGGVQDFSSLGPGDTIDDGSIDDVKPMDFFNTDLYPPPECDDVAQCRDETVSLAQGALSSG